MCFFSAQHEMDKAEYLFFLTGGIGLENKHKNPGQGWLSDKSWDELCRLSDLSKFVGLRYEKLFDYLERSIQWALFVFVVKVLKQISQAFELSTIRKIR